MSRGGGGGGVSKRNSKVVSMERDGGSGKERLLLIQSGRRNRMEGSQRTGPALARERDHAGRQGVDGVPLGARRQTKQKNDETSVGGKNVLYGTMLADLL